MISLGIAEMVAACALMFPGFFGGEGGIATNRVVGEPWLGITLRSADPGLLPDRGMVLRCDDRDVCADRTPLGRMANAVRDNPERAKFVGYNPTRVRYLIILLASLLRRHRAAAWARSTTKSSPPRTLGRWPLRQRRC